METLNKYAADVMLRYRVRACTDVTGFGLLGHLYEMLDDSLGAVVNSRAVPHIDEAYSYAEQFLLTAAAQRNRNYLKDKVDIGNVGFALQELMFDPQTSGGLLMAVEPTDADALVTELTRAGILAAMVGEMTRRGDYCIVVG
jgi:selenide,water dikinase